MNRDSDGRSDLSKVDYIRNELILMPTEEYQPHIVPVIPNLNNNNTAVEANGFAKVGLGSFREALVYNRV